MAEDIKIDDLNITDEMIAERRLGVPGETPDDTTPWMRPIISSIDLMNLWVGRITCLLLIPIVFVMVFEVVARKVFLAPTDFSFEYSRMLAGAMFMLGAGYALMRGVHIRADFLYRNWTLERQATIDATLYLLFYFPAILFFFWISAEFTIKAWFTWERSMDTAMMAPLAPARTAMPLAALFLFLQGISELLKSLYDMGADLRWKFTRFLPYYAVLLALVFLNAFYPEYLPFRDRLFSVAGGIGPGGISNEAIGLMMIAVMLFSIFVGFPISFTLIFLGFVFGAWGFSGKLTFYLQTFQFNSTMLDDQLVAVPLFVFMGIMMEQAGLMERLFTSVQLMFSRTRGALLLSLAYRKLTVKKLYDALIKTLEIAVLIMFLVAASNFFGAVFSRLGTPTMVTELLLSWDLSKTLVLIIIMALIFLLGGRWNGCRSC